MKTPICLVVVLLINCITSYSQTYPHTKTGNEADVFHGVTYPDPLRWLEDIKNPEVEEWFKNQAQFTDGQLGKIKGIEALAKEWTDLSLLQQEKYNDIYFRGGIYFYKKTLPNESVGKIYMRKSIHAPEELLFDPTTFMAGRTLSVTSIKPSFDGKYVGVAYSEMGAEIGSVLLINVQNKQVLPQKYGPNYNGITEWMPDNSGFLWIKLTTADMTSPELFMNLKTMYQSIDLNQPSTDFFSKAKCPNLPIDSADFPVAFISEDLPNYVFGGLFSVQNEMRMYYAPLQKSAKELEWKMVSSLKDGLIGTIEFHQGKVFAMSTKNASNIKLLATQLENPNWDQAEIIVPEKKESLEEFVKCKDYLVLVYSDGINCSLYKYAFSNKKLEKIETPLSGTFKLSVLDKKSNDVTVKITSWNNPAISYDLNVDKNSFTRSEFSKPSNYPKTFDELVVEEVEVKGHDGVMIPLSLIYKKGLKKDGQNTCVMEAYGAYGSSSKPSFDIMYTTLATKGVVIAIPHVRGGGEKGYDWYMGGYKTTKANTWKDFISCAEWLLKNGYTSASKLGGMGTSAGGIMITRAITERPDLFAAGVCNVGIANALRFEFTPNGANNSKEFGSTSDATECKALFEMDGVAHIKKGENYPAVLCVAGWNDPRVIPWQPGKFAAMMQLNSASKKPALLKVNYDSGHFTEEKNIMYLDFAHQFGFVLWQCGHRDFQ
jgi:prolyl oligopeptidase